MASKFMASKLMASKLMSRVVPAAVLAMLAAAIGMCVATFAGIQPRAVLASIEAIPPYRLAVAACLTAVSYLLLTCYDFLALRYVRRDLRFQDVLFTSFTAFAFSNNLGFQLFSGGSIRLRTYSTLGLNAVEVGELVGFCTLTYALGVITVCGLLAVLETAEIASLTPLTQPMILAGGVAMLAASAAYLAFAAFRIGPIGLWGYRLRMPSLTLAGAQISLASIDAVLAASVMYVLLPTDASLPFGNYLSVYMIASTVSVLSLVPGGLGVYETAVALMTATASKTAILGVLLIYRLTYFVIPLAIAVALLVQHEIRLLPRLRSIRFCSRKRSIGS